eukprot:scaffold41687_cov23-Cyclotella_meneghiniana.AAC.1
MTRSFSAVALLLATGFVITDGLLTPSRSHVVNSDRPLRLRLPGDGLSVHYGLNSGQHNAPRLQTTSDANNEFRSSKSPIIGNVRVGL